jgi:serine/threonine-protein kinase
MNAPNWDRVKELFQRALDQPLDNRAQWLEERCGRDAALLEVQSLFATHEAAGSFADQAAGDLCQALDAGSAGPGALQPGDPLGVYAIQSLLGANGMGEVYMTRDTRVDRTVAIKILAAGRSRPQSA